MEITTEKLSKLPEDTQAFTKFLTDLRHELHRHPEPSMKEVHTAAFVADILKKLGLEVTEHIGGTGVVATLSNGTSKKAIGLRAELDALQMQETNGVPYASENAGCAHACGHDGHMTMLLGAAIKLAHDRNFNGTVRFFFQPGEESGEGAKAMIADGVLDKLPVDEMFTIHNSPTKAFGTIRTNTGGFQASEDDFKISITGKGGHASKPHLAIDPLVIGAEVVLALQTIVSRYVSPQDCAVVSCTEFHTDGSHNAIGTHAVITGDCRSYSPAVQDIIENKMRAIVDHICTLNGATGTVEYDRCFAPTINDSNCTTQFVKAARDVLGKENGVDDEVPSMGSEDFGAFLLEKPGAYADLGTCELKDSSQAVGLHNAAFDFNDHAIAKGVDVWCQLVKNYLAE
ncbi:MAG: amidohydrolase [Acidaminococcus sp.]|jgi:hippurate hydrolase|nr:amidohydrolase [Acidaminococcus sp.]MCI2114421.1 amidohydrolase [Acidaminococcus sp.]MCI2116190.1 amidohydrolase [Acidaminococcus sp.]